MKFAQKKSPFLLKKEIAPVRQHTRVQFLSVIFIILLWSTNLFSGPIYDAYKKIEEQINKEKNGAIDKKKQLEETLLKSLKAALVKSYNYADYDGIALPEMQYEMAEGIENAYFVKYKDFLAYFSYSQDPRLYFMFPLEQKVIIDPKIGIGISKFKIKIDDWAEEEPESNSEKKTKK